LLTFRNQAGLIAVLAFYVGASMYYYLFYRARLVPRWLSGWGLAGTTLGAIAGLLVLFRVTGYMSTPQVALNLPIGVNEIVLAIWLLVRGFDSPAARPAPVTEGSDGGARSGAGSPAVTAFTPVEGSEPAGR
jgi:hypothetical protein